MMTGLRIQRPWRCGVARAATGLLAALALLPVLAGGRALAAPKGAQVVNGNVQIVQNGNLTTITASNHSIINYQSFNIAQPETVKFIQPGAQAKVLNRILGVDPTIIAGTLLANGRVYIVNPAGIYFVDGSLVNVGALYAAAGQITDKNFLSNVNQFTGLSGAVMNSGLLRGNEIALIGSQVANFGAIVADNGLVSLVSGADVYFTDNDGKILVKLTGGVPAATGAGVQNSGTIQAPGGKVNLGAGDLYALAIFNNGRIQANQIKVEGQGPGTVQVSGALDASNPYGVGGTIDVLGDNIVLSGASLNASGATGGGTILVGGDLHGANPAVRDASQTCVSADSTINADALVSGDGGKVVVWSNLDTRFYGSVTARGGASAGNGGNVEISGQYLDLQGTVNTLAPHGSAGTLLLDPVNLTIDATEWGVIDALLVGGNLVESATNNITVTAPSGDLGSSFKLTLDAGNVFMVNASCPITNSGGGGFEFAGTAGGIHLGSDVNSGAGAQTYDNAVTLGASVTLTASTVTFKSTVNAFSVQSLTVTGNALFQGLVGNVTPLSSLDVTGTTGMGAGTVATTGTQIYGGPVTLPKATVLDATTVTFDSKVDGSYSLTVNGNAVFDGLVGSGTPLLSLDVTGTTTMDAGTVSTSGTQEYGGAVTLSADTTLNATTATFDGKVDGAHSLMVAGNAVFDGLVGGGTPLTSLDVTGTTALNGGISGLTPTVSTTGDQTYTGPVTLGAPVTVLYDSGSGIAFDSAVDSASGHNYALTVETLGAADFYGQVGAAVALSTLTVEGISALDNYKDGTTLLSAAGTIASPSVQTTGDQTYNNPVTLGQNTVLASGDTVTFNRYVNGAGYNLTVYTVGGVGGNVVFGDSDGDSDSPYGFNNLTVYGSLAFGSDATAEFTIAGTETFYGPVTLPTGLTSYTFNAGALVFGSTVNLDACGMTNVRDGKPDLQRRPRLGLRHRRGGHLSARARRPDHDRRRPRRAAGSTFRRTRSTPSRKASR